MMAIRIPKEHWGDAWAAMIEIAPIRMIAKDPICEVLPAHLRLLKSRRIPYEVVKDRLRASAKAPTREKRRRAQAD